MIRFIADHTWHWDAEWVPDPETGRRLFGLSATTDDDTVRTMLFARAGATEEDPRPFLKTVLCRIVSVATVARQQIDADRVSLVIQSSPKLDELGVATALDEGVLLTKLLRALNRRPQLVGFNSVSADLPAIMQRAAVHGLTAPKFCEKPEKPWKGKDYFAKHSDWHVDLQTIWGGWGKSTPSLHELCAAFGIPGKDGVSGDDVLDLWKRGDIATIVAYNVCDALRTYLVWLRAVTLCGLMTPDARLREEDQCRAMLRQVGETHAYLLRFLDQWNAMVL